MKRFLFIASILSLLVIVGCRTATQRRKAVAREAVPPPLPPRFKPSKGIIPSGPKTVAPSYATTDFAITSVRTQAGDRVVLAWQNGTPPFQPQSKPDVLSPWVDFGPSTMQQSVTNPAPYGFTRAFFRVKSIASTPGQVQWVKTFQNTTPCAVTAASIATDSSGNTVTVGKFSGAIDFGKGIVSSMGNATDVFIVKHNPQGVAIWVKTMGNTGSDSASGVAIDSQNNIIVVGQFAGTVNFGGASLTDAGGGDIFVAKYNNANPPGLLWAKRFGGNFPDSGRAVTVGSGGIFVASWFMSQNADFGGFTLNSVGSQDIALLKLDSNGSAQWAKGYGGAFSDFPDCVVLDNVGNLWVGGHFSGTTDLGTGPKPNFDPSGDTADMFLAKYSSADGSCLFARTMGGAFNDSLNGIARDPITGNIIIAGGVSPHTDLGGGIINSGLGVAAFVAGYRSDGNYLWSKTWGGLDVFAQDIANAVAMDASGNVVVSGRTASFLDFGQGPIPGAGYTTLDFSVAGNTAPVFRWAKRANYIESNGNSVAFDSLGHVTIAGGLFGQMTIDGITYGIGTAYSGGFSAQHAK